MYGQYRVVTPTMYRSRVHATMMASTRQALSMDEDRPRTPGKRKSGALDDELALRPASLSPRAGGDVGAAAGSASSRYLRHHAGARQQQDSLELELGASATRVWRERERVGGGHQQQQHSGGSGSYRGRSNNSNNTDGCELALDLHIEGSRPVTLFVRDESHSTSGRQDTTNTASSTPKSNNGRSPAHSGSALPPPQPLSPPPSPSLPPPPPPAQMASLALQLAKEEEEEAEIAKVSSIMEQIAMEEEEQSVE